MNDYLSKIEKTLMSYAIDYTPPDTKPEAVIHQWVKALISNSDLFAQARGVDKNTVLNILKTDNLYKNPESFKIEIMKNVNIKPVENPSFKFIDLFAGIGGMRMGFESSGGECVFSSEFEKNAQKTYFENYGELSFGDITKISEQDIPSHDILIGGFPCQPFSHAGLKLGIDDTRGTLFYNIARIIKSKKPKMVLLENVKGLLSHDKGYTFQVILNTLVDIGYSCIIDNTLIKSGDTVKIKKEAKKMVLRSIDFGVPQNRQRIYIILWRNDLNIDFSYPEPLNIPTSVKSILTENPDSKYTISDRLWAGHKRRKINNKKNGKGFGYGLVGPDSPYTNTISARYYKDGSEVLIEQENANPRKITPREAARLQGFPEKFLINGSDVQAYKQFGNSVSLPVIKIIASAMLEGIKNE